MRLATLAVIAFWGFSSCTTSRSDVTSAGSAAAGPDCWVQIWQDENFQDDCACRSEGLRGGNAMFQRPEHVALRRPSLHSPIRFARRRCQVGWAVEDLTAVAPESTFRSDGRRR